MQLRTVCTNTTPMLKAMSNLLSTSCVSPCNDMCVSVRGPCKSEHCGTKQSENGKLIAHYCVPFPANDMLVIHLPMMENIPVPIKLIGQLMLPDRIQQVYVAFLKLTFTGIENCFPRIRIVWCDLKLFYCLVHWVMQQD